MRQYILFSNYRDNLIKQMNRRVFKKYQEIEDVIFHREPYKIFNAIDKFLIRQKLAPMFFLTIRGTVLVNFYNAEEYEGIKELHEYTAIMYIRNVFIPSILIYDDDSAQDLLDCLYGYIVRQ